MAHGDIQVREVVNDAGTAKRRARVRASGVFTIRYTAAPIVCWKLVVEYLEHKYRRRQSQYSLPILLLVSHDSTYLDWGVLEASPRWWEVGYNVLEVC